MTIENQLRLSYYREIGDVNAAHGVKLVQHVENGRVFVRKTLTVYDIRVFRYLAAHPTAGTPRIAELVEDDNTLYVIEEYISGVSLREMLRERGPLSEREAAEYVRQLCVILSPFHRLTPPIVHRDIKPENLIVKPDGELVLVDFNSAKESASGGTRDTVLIGTAGYAAPEQYGFSPSTPAADVYAAGVLLNELATGRPPKEQLCTGRLGRIVTKCTQMDPGSRYRDADELFRALCAAEKSEGGPVTGIRGWLPPGLGSRKFWVVLLAVPWYAFFTAISFSLQVKDAAGGELVLNRIFCFLLFLAETFWVGNYRQVQTHLPLSDSGKPLIRVLGVVLWGAVLMFGVFAFLAVAESLI